MEQYRSKFKKISAEQLQTDAIANIRSKNKDIYLNGGTYLIQDQNGALHPIEKDIFEFLFEKEEKENE